MPDVWFFPDLNCLIEPLGFLVNSSVFYIFDPMHRTFRYCKSVCLSLSGESYLQCRRQLVASKLAEFRPDISLLTPEETEQLLDSNREWIVALRQDGLRREQIMSVFEVAMKARLRFIDIDFSIFRNDMVQKLLQLLRKNSIPLIYSWHSFDHTPSQSELSDLIVRMKNAGADAIKIATYARQEGDVEIVRGLYDQHQNITAFCMGEHGRETRLEAAMRGLKLTYACPDHGSCTAPGQYRYSEMLELLEKRYL